HLAVLRLLGVEQGVVAVTKADAVDEETLELALDEARELVPGAEVVAVSAKTGSGLDELRAALAGLPVEERGADGPARLYVDRVFSLAGAGTIATGTLWSGSIAPGDTLRVEPAGREVRVRSVQVHDAAVERAAAGQRVAVNLPQLERRELARGDALVTPSRFRASYRLDVRLTELAELPAAVTVHLGTLAVPARLARDGELAQLRLERQVVAARGDRVVLRTETTVGGAVVVDPAPPRGLDRGRIEAVERGEVPVHEPVRRDELLARFDAAAVDALPSASGFVFAQAWFDELRERVHARLAQASALDPGVPIAELGEPWAIELLDVERRNGKAYLPGATAQLGARAEAAAALEARLAAEEIAKVDDRELAAFLEQEGRLRRVGDGFAVSAETYERGLALLRTLDPITIASFRDALGVGRRTAQLLLERYDADGRTLRRGDVRVLRRRG
ncbi:MAG TPA: SelB C-terminal domain-containing protein, partial [Gaiellaceae bacterium]|nr:SelB C-terminal domain-containing protein [Gaiellaceae bacterium]